MKYSHIFKNVVLCIALLFIAWAVIIYPERYITTCLQGFLLWAECVLPSLFPFMVICAILIKTGMAEKAALPLKKVTGIFGLPPAAAVCFIMSICSGYPAGSRSVLEFYERGAVSEKDAKKLAYLCSTSGPLFIIGSVGVKMFSNKGAGWKILLAHALAVIIIALVISLFSKRGARQELSRAMPNGNILYAAFYGAVVSVLMAGGFIAFFCVVGQIAIDFYLLYPLEKCIALFCDGTTASAVCRGLIEATAGCRALAATDGRFTLPFAGFLITFGGISILMQQLSYLLKAKVSAFKFISVKLLQGLLCFGLLLLF